jgi:hypothetical protein
MKEKKQKVYPRGIRKLAITAGIIGVALSFAYNYHEEIGNACNRIANRKVYREFAKIEQYYDKNRDGEMSIEEKYFMYSKFGLEYKPIDYTLNVNEMKKVIEEYNELDKAQFGIFDNLPSKTLEKKL